MTGYEQQEGAAAVELGLLLPLLIMLAFGIIEFSTAYNRSQGMQAGVREAVRYAATGDIEDSLIKGRLTNALQANDGGSGFPAAGGSGNVDDDVDVVVEYFPDKPAFDADSPSIVAGRCTAAYAVRVTASIAEEHRLVYGLSLPLIPGSPFEISHQSEAIFRCLG